jgi:predicted flap endonuclease-1-like 5' DNA nuclease
MSNEPADGVDADVPDAVREWLGSVAAERGLTEEELLASMLAEGPPEPAGGVDQRELDRFEDRFRSMIDDVRDRVIQVKREADDKAPADHTHHDLRTSIDEVGEEVGSLESRLEQLDDRLATGFSNYEEILTYLTETTDTLNRRLARLASAVIELREQVGEATRDEVRRTALSHLTETANRHGVETARCDGCGAGVDLGLLVEPRCPHCDAAFSSLEPKSGFFRKSVLHTGSLPALESPDIQPEDEARLESIAAGVEGGAGSPTVGEAARAGGPAEAETAAGDGGDGSAADTVDPESDGTADLERIDGIGPTYAGRLEDAGIDGLLALAIADPEELGEAIDVPATTVADWVEQADARTGST